MAQGGKWNHLLPVMLGAALAMSATASNAAGGKTYAGKTVKIGNGEAHTIVRTDAAGKLSSVGVVLTATALEGLPVAAPGADPDFPFTLAMPTSGPKTVFRHVLVNWESTGHPPPKVYDVPHFDFHFYVVAPAKPHQPNTRNGFHRNLPPEIPQELN